MIKLTSTVATLCLLSISFSAFGASTPTSQGFDQRIRKYNYNHKDVAVIKLAEGYVTSIILDPSESIQDMLLGFKEAYDISNSGNIIYIKPIALGGGETGEVIFPNAKDWKTNLNVKTNKNFYVFELNVVDAKDSSKMLLVDFNYPLEVAKQQKQQQIAMQEQKEQELLEQKLNAFPIPKNWNYTAIKNQDSNAIMPNFVFDDGQNTYFGFDSSKEIPSVFLIDDKEETLVNTVIKSYGNEYKLLVATKVGDGFYLRSGKKLIAVYNKSYAKNVTPYQDTIKPNVIREVRG